MNSRNHWRLVLLPLSWIYGAVTWTRNMLYDQGVLTATGFNIPTLLVGNISVGGTGKTPHVEYLVQLLKEAHRVAILSRGYLRKSRDFRIATSESSSREVGDEPRQMKRRFPGVTVAVDRKRVNGIRELMKLAPPIEAIVLDDAFQHRSLKAGCNILLIDYARPILEDRLLPAGDLRESPRGRHRANIILVSKCPDDLKPIEMREYVNQMKLSLGQHLFFTRMKMESLVPVFEEASLPDREWNKHTTGGVLVLSGVVNPGSLMDYARTLSDNLREMRFRDHYRYSEKDVLKMVDQVEALGKDPKNPGREVLILTTEKDAAKLSELNMPEYIRDRLYALRLGVEFLNGDEENFKQQILSYVTSNKRSSILYQGEDQRHS